MQIRTSYALVFCLAAGSSNGESIRASTRTLVVCAGLLSSVTGAPPVLARPAEVIEQPSPEARESTYRNFAHAGDVSNLQRAIIMDSFREKQEDLRRSGRTGPVWDPLNAWELRDAVQSGRVAAGQAAFSGGLPEAMTQLATAATFAMFPQGRAAQAGSDALRAVGTSATVLAIATRNKYLDSVVTSNVPGKLSRSMVAEYNVDADLMLMRGEAPAYLREALDIPGYVRAGAEDAALAAADRFDDETNDVIALRAMKEKIPDRVLRTKAMAARLQRKTGKPSGEALALLVSSANEVAGDIKEALPAADRPSSRGERPLVSFPEAAAHASEAFGTVALVAKIAGNPEVERFFSKAGALGQSVVRIANLSRADFRVNPFGCANLYLTAVSLALDLFGGTRDEALLVTLRQIQQQLETMRREMNERFDRLEVKIDHFMGVSLVHFERLERAQEITLSLLNELNRQQARTMTLLAKGLGALDDAGTAGEAAACLVPSPSGRILPASSPEALRRCLTHYLRLTMGESVLIQESARLGAYAEPLPSRDGAAELRPSDADSYRFGAARLKMLYDANPRSAYLFQLPVEVRPGKDYAVSAAVARGRTLARVSESLLVRDGRFNTALVGGLLKSFRSAGKDITDQAPGAIESVSKGLPSPWDPTWRLEAPKSPSTYRSPTLDREFLNPCVPGSRVLRDWPGGDKHGDDVERVQIERLGDAFPTSKLSLSQPILNLLPPFARWADHHDQSANGAAPYRVHACAVPKLTLWGKNKKNRVWRVEWDLSVDVYVEFGRDNDRRSLLVQRLSGASRPTASDGWINTFPLANAPGFFELMWTGASTGGEAFRLYGLGGAARGFSFRDDPARFLTAIETPEILANRALIEADLAARVNENEALIVAKALAEAGPQIARMREIKVQLTYLLTHFIDGDDPRVVRFRNAIENLPIGEDVVIDALTMSGGESLARLDARLRAIQSGLADLATIADLRSKPSDLTRFADQLDAIRVFRGAADGRPRSRAD